MTSSINADVVIMSKLGLKYRMRTIQTITRNWRGGLKGSSASGVFIADKWVVRIHLTRGWSAASWIQGRRTRDHVGSIVIE